ncbi:MAG: nuclear transport factor 2 family protein [Actinomycetota bacterium]|jgi:ketosteroid isomerase-like protein|nr:nuclear transport factor 2 family protein [Rubrobacter sp.]MDQ3238654.1 nuclear transport factor 2 family protein [Actinomycetota bacterium]
MLKDRSEKEETNMREQDSLQERNLALMRRFYEARANKDLERIMECLTEDVVWRYPGRNVLSREYRGKEDVASFFRSLRELTGDDFSSKVERILVDENVALVYEHPSGTMKGRSLEWETVLVFNLRDGGIAEGKAFQHTQYELDE